MLIKIGFVESTFSSEHTINNTILGQTQYEDMDGYTTTYTTLSTRNRKTYIEYKQNLSSSSWCQNPYWGDTMEKNGCGITSISIIASGYHVDVTPEDLREKYYPHLNATDIQKALKKLGIESTDFYFHDEYLSEEYIISWLESNRPILICLDNTKYNKWTQSSHYMVLLDVDSDDKVYVSNPNGLDKTEKASGWYDIDSILPYTVKALFIEDY